MQKPDHGDVIQGAGGLRKLRFASPNRQKGKRSGLRVIYFWRISASQFWKFSIYDKDEVSDLSPPQRQLLHDPLKRELSLQGELDE